MRSSMQCVYIAQANREAVVAVYMECGSDIRLKRDDIMQKKEVLKRSYEGTVRKRTGREIEKSLFLRRYADRPDMIKKAKFHTVKTRCSKTNKIILQQVTRVYDQEDGERIFEDFEGQEVSQLETIDAGLINLHEDQQERAADDAFDLHLKDDRGSTCSVLRASEVDGVTSKPATAKAANVAAKADFASPAKASQSGRRALGSSSDEDELSPMERAALASTSSKQQAKKKAKASPSKPSHGSSTVIPSRGGSGGGGGGGMGAATDRNIQVLCEEMNSEMENLVKCKSLKDIKEETLASLITRFGQKKTVLGKKAGKDKSGQTVSLVDDITTRKSRLQCILDLHKAATLWERKMNRKNASAISDKVAAMRASGVTNHMVPPCLSAYATFASVFVQVVDKKFKDASRYCSIAEVEMEIGTDVDAAERDAIQVRAASLCLSEFVRHSAEEKMSLQQAQTKMIEHCNDLGVSTGPLLRKLCDSIVNSMGNDLVKKKEASCLFLCVCVFTSNQIEC